MNTDKWLADLYHTNAGRIYRIAAYLLHSRLGHASDAQDVVQEVFLLASRSKELRGHPKPGAWLAVTARNVCSNHIRSQFRIERKRDKAGRSLTKKSVHSVYAYQEPSSNNIDEADVMLSLKQSLSPKEYELIRAYSIEQRSTAEIAAATGLSENHVRVRIYRIREKIRKIFPNL